MIHLLKRLGKHVLMMLLLLIFMNPGRENVHRQSMGGNLARKPADPGSDEPTVVQEKWCQHVNLLHDVSKFDLDVHCGVRCSCAALAPSGDFYV